MSVHNGPEWWKQDILGTCLVPTGAAAYSHEGVSLPSVTHVRVRR